MTTMAEYIEKWSVVNRLIDIENEFQQYKPFHGFEHAMYRKICEAEIAIGKTQAADVAPIRHGHWIRVNLIGVFECSECGNQITVTDSKFAKEVCKWCLHCGAKMDEEVSK